MSVKHQRVKFHPLKTNLKALVKKKKREGRVKREVKKGEKRKVGKQNFYTKPSDLTHA
jgi:hypothetical protein